MENGVIPAHMKELMIRLNEMIEKHGELLVHSSMEVLARIEKGMGGCAGSTMFFAPGFRSVEELLSADAYCDFPHVHVCARVGAAARPSALTLSRKEEMKVKRVLEANEDDLACAGYRVVDGGVADLDDDDDEPRFTYDDLVCSKSTILDGINDGGWLQQELQARAAARDGYAFVRAWDDQGEVLFTCTNGDHVDVLNENFLNIDELRAAYRENEGAFEEFLQEMRAPA